MTKNELSQLYWLSREIERDKARLEELETAAAYTGIDYKDCGHGKGGVQDKVGNMAILIYEQRKLIENKTERAYIEQNRLYRFIDSVDDSLMRQILQLRYINGLTWQRIAFEIEETDEQYPRRKHNEFLKKLTKMTKDMCYNDRVER